MTDKDSTPSRKRTRSPAYPAVGLREAIERAKTIYEYEKRHAAPMDAVLSHWGYSPGSGPGATTLSALRKFGLVEYEGKGTQRKVRLTPLAIEVLLRESDSPERTRALEKAALSPTIHRTLWEEHGPNLPSDRSLRLDLIRDYHFTETAVDDLIEQYRDTIEYAGLMVSEPISPDLGDTSLHANTGAPDMRSANDARGQQPGELKSIQVPVGPNRWATLQAPFPLTGQEWTQMIKVLDAMKPALVAASFNPDLLSMSMFDADRSATDEGPRNGGAE